MYCINHISIADMQTDMTMDHIIQIVKWLALRHSQEGKGCVLVFMYWSFKI
jgi:hypothetical protein